MNETSSQKLASTVLVARIVFAGLLGSQAIYGFLMPGMAGEAPIPLAEALAQPMTLFLVLYALASLFASFAIPRFLLLTKARNIRKEGRKPTIAEMAAFMFTTTIVALALREAISIIGLLAASMTKSTELGHLMMAAGAISMLFAWPSEDRWIGQIEKVISRTE